jgi:hypothetical protein
LEIVLEWRKSTRNDSQNDHQPNEGGKMKKLIVAITVILFFCGSAYAADYCDTKYMKYIDGLKKTGKIMEDQKKKYLPYLEKARDLCKQGNMEEARKVMDEVKDAFFLDALTHEETFFSN